MDSYVQEEDDNDVYDKEDDDDHSRVFLGAKAPHRCRMPGELDNSAYHDYTQVCLFVFPRVFGSLSLLLLQLNFFLMTILGGF